MHRALTILLLTFWCAIAVAQTDSVRAPRAWHATVAHDVGTFWQAFVAVGSAPARWQGQDVAHAGVSIGVTGVVAFGDEGGTVSVRSREGPETGSNRWCGCTVRCGSLLH